MSQEAFADFMARAIVALPQDLKILLEMVDDADLDEPLRMLAAGAIVYSLSPSDALPNSSGALGYVDDALVVRMAMNEIVRRATERGQAYRAKYAEVFDSLEADLAAARAFLGDAFLYFTSRMETISRDEYRGKRPVDCVQNPDASAWLHDEVIAKNVEMEFDEEEVQRAVKKISTVLPRLKQKAETVRRA